jgi:hypothetical protein
MNALVNLHDLSAISGAKNMSGSRSVLAAAVIFSFAMVGSVAAMPADNLVSTAKSSTAIQDVAWRGGAWRGVGWRGVGWRRRSLAGRSLARRRLARRRLARRLGMAASCRLGMAPAVLRRLRCGMGLGKPRLGMASPGLGMAPADLRLRWSTLGLGRRLGNAARMGMAPLVVRPADSR